MAAVLLVVGNSTSLSAGDIVVRNALIADGHTVTIRDDGDGNKTGTGYAVVVHAESCSSSSLSGYKSIPEGLVCLKHSAWDAELGLTATGTAISSGIAASFTPLASSISSLAGFAVGVSLTGWSTASPARVARNNTTYFPTGTDVIPVAGFDQGSSQDLLAFAYESGTVLADTTVAAGRRVAIGLNDDGVVNATANLLDLLTASVRWASGQNPSGGGTGDTLFGVEGVLDTVGQVATLSGSGTGGSGAANLLFVVGDLTLTAGNSVLKAALETAGHTVTTRDDNDANKSVTGYDAAILASDASSGNLTGYLTAAAPLVILAHGLTDDALMWTGGSSMTTRNPYTDFEMLAGDIATAAGVSPGVFTAFSTGSEYRTLTTGNMLNSAVIFLRGSGHPGASSSVAGWYIPQGETLSDGVTTAPGLRMFTPPLSVSAQNATTTLLKVFVAAVELAAGVTGGGGGPTGNNGTLPGVTSNRGAVAHSGDFLTSNESSGPAGSALVTGIAGVLTGIEGIPTRLKGATGVLHTTPRIASMGSSIGTYFNGATGLSRVLIPPGEFFGYVITNAELARVLAAPILRRLARMRRKIRRYDIDPDARMHGRARLPGSIDDYGR